MDFIYSCHLNSLVFQGESTKSNQQIDIQIFQWKHQKIKIS